MTDFLLELRSEEIPARMQAKAREDLARLFTERLTALDVTFGEVVTYATPRRLALIVRDLPEETAAVQRGAQGPPRRRARAGARRLPPLDRPDPRATRRARRRQGRQGPLRGHPAPRPAACRRCSPPRSATSSTPSPGPSRCAGATASASTESLRWVRPLQGIVALFGDRIVEVEVAGVRSGAATVGHRFHHPGAITIGCGRRLRRETARLPRHRRPGRTRRDHRHRRDDADRGGGADVGPRRRAAGRERRPDRMAGAAARPLRPRIPRRAARGDPAHRAGEPEVFRLRTTASGKLANAFVCVANIDAADGGDKIVEGNRKVLAARLSDARFFYETDLKTKLEDLTPKLEKIVFHEKLGTVADKVDRVAKLARWLVEEGIVKSSPCTGRGTARSVVEGGGHERCARGEPPPPRLAAVPLPAQGRRDLADLAERAARLARPTSSPAWSANSPSSRA